MIDLDDDEVPNLAFQHAQFSASRWPDSAYPAQLHVDYRFTVDNERPHYQTRAAKAAMERAEELGAIHLRNVVYADPAGHPSASEPTTRAPNRQDFNVPTAAQRLKPLLANSRLAHR